MSQEFLLASKDKLDFEINLFPKSLFKICNLPPVSSRPESIFGVRSTGSWVGDGFNGGLFSAALHPAACVYRYTIFYHIHIHIR